MVTTKIYCMSPGGGKCACETGSFISFLGWREERAAFFWTSRHGAKVDLQHPAALYQSKAMMGAQSPKVACIFSSSWAKRRAPCCLLPNIWALNNWIWKPNHAVRRVNIWAPLIQYVFFFLNFFSFLKIHYFETNGTTWQSYYTSLRSLLHKATLTLKGHMLSWYHTQNLF